MRRRCGWRNCPRCTESAAATIGSPQRHVTHEELGEALAEVGESRETAEREPATLRRALRSA
jgi:hypothetical protein